MTFHSSTQTVIPSVRLGVSVVGRQLETLFPFRLEAIYFETRARVDRLGPKARQIQDYHSEATNKHAEPYLSYIFAID